MNKPDWERFVRWLASNTVFAFIPLFSVWFFRSLFKKNTLDASNDYPEVIFIAIIVCVTALADIASRKERKKWKLAYVLFESVLFFGLIGSAIMYGGLRLVNVTTPLKLEEAATFANSIDPPSLNSAIFFTVCCAVIGIISEIALTYTEVGTIQTER